MRPFLLSFDSPTRLAAGGDAHTSAVFVVWVPLGNLSLYSLACVNMSKILLPCGIVENIGFEPMTSCVRCKRSSQAEPIPRGRSRRVGGHAAQLPVFPSS